MRSSSKKSKDPLGHYKDFIAKHPGKKGVISNIGYKPFILIMDPAIAKDLYS